jgi:hypothetical protein
MPMITLFKLCSSIVPIHVAILEVSLIFEEAHSRSAPWRRGYVNNATMKLSPQGTAVDEFLPRDGDRNQRVFIQCVKSRGKHILTTKK